MSTGFGHALPGPVRAAPSLPPHLPDNAGEQGSRKRKRDDDEEDGNLRPVGILTTEFAWSICRLYPRACNLSWAPHEVQGPWGFNHVPCASDGRVFPDSVIIAVAGACPGNGTDKATKSSGGVYVGDLEGHATKWRNIAFRLPDHPEYRHTNQRAELAAAWVGMSCGLRLATEGGQWDPKSEKPVRAKHVVIKSDSSYLVESITQHITKWASNGWQTSSEAPLANRPIWQLLAGCMEDFDDMGVGIHFWLVPRESNKEAHRLAQLGTKATLVLGRDNLLPPSNIRQTY